MKLDILKGWDKNIKENYAIIEQSNYKIKELKEELRTFTKDSCFINSRNNYAIIYQHILEFKEKIEKKFEPEMARTRIEKGLFAKIK